MQAEAGCARVIKELRREFQFQESHGYVGFSHVDDVRVLRIRERKRRCYRVGPSTYSATEICFLM